MATKTTFLFFRDIDVILTVLFMESLALQKINFDFFAKMTFSRS
jgi:hypothetical protein